MNAECRMQPENQKKRHPGKKKIFSQLQDQIHNIIAGLIERGHTFLIICDISVQGPLAHQQIKQPGILAVSAGETSSQVFFIHISYFYLTYSSYLPIPYTASSGSSSPASTQYSSASIPHDSHNEPALRKHTEPSSYPHFS